MLNMSANLENPAVATGLEKGSFHSNLKEGQCQTMFKLAHKTDMTMLTSQSSEVISKSFKVGFRGT